MEKVRISRNEVFLSFSPHFYRKEMIEQAARDFRKAAEVRKTAKGFVLRPHDRSNLQTIGYEFYNYVLGLMRNE